MTKRKLENVEQRAQRAKKRRGPAPKPRLSDIEVAHLLHGVARRKRVLSSVSDALGWSKYQRGNVIKGRRGVTEIERSALEDIAVLPHSPSWDALATDPWEWFSRLTYQPLLCPSPLSLAPPQARVSADKIVFHATLIREADLAAQHPALRAVPGTPGPPFELHTWRGTYPAFIERSKADWYRIDERRLGFDASLNIRARINGKRVTLAKLSVGPRWSRVERDLARFEITGLGCTLGLAPALTQLLFAPFIDPRTAQLAEIHLAIDIDAPSHCLVPFQQRASGKGVLRAQAIHWNDFDNVGLGFGSRKSGFCGTFYDKRRQVSDVKFAENGAGGPPRSRIAILPDHASRFTHLARIEFRFRPKRLGLTGPPASVLLKLRDWVSTFAIADLRYLGQATPEAALACEAQRYGFTPQPPTLKGIRSKRKATEAGQPAPLNHGERCLAGLLALNVNPEWAEQVAQTLHAATLAELIRVSAATPIDLRCMVHAAIARLQRDLDACLTAPSGLGVHAMSRALPRVA